MSLDKNSRPKPDAREKHRFFRTDHLTANLARRAARGGATTLLSQGLKFVISTAATVVLARLLTPHDYGLIGMVAIIVNFVTMFQYLGLSTATIRWVELDHRQVSALFWLNLALSGTAALATLAAAPAIAWFYKEPVLVNVTLGYAAIIFLNGLSIQHDALLYRQMRFTAVALIDLIALTAGLTAAVAAAWKGAGYWALVINQLTVSLVRTVELWIACRWRPGPPARDAGVGSIIAFGKNLTGFSVMDFFARNLDRALLGKFWGAQQLGLYTKAYQVLLVPLDQIIAPMTAVAVPALSRLNTAPERYRSAYLQILEKVAMLTMPLVTFMIASSDWIILLLLGPQWAGSARIFMLLGIAAMVQPTAMTVHWLFPTQGRAREMFHWGVIGGSIAVLSIIAGLPWGAVGVATSYALADLCVSTPLLFWYAGRRGHVRTADFYRTVMPSVCASVCVLAALLIARPWLENYSLVARLALAFAITCAGSLLVLATLPAGRAAIQNFKALFLLLMKEEKKESAV